MLRISATVRIAWCAHASGLGVLRSVGFRGLGFRGLGFRVWGLMVRGFRGLGRV